MALAAALIASFALLPSVAAGQHGTPAITGPLFSDFPVRTFYTGFTANPRFKSHSEEDYLSPLLRVTDYAPNFSGQFRLIKFQIGSGPIGALLVDSKTGSVYHLPPEAVKDKFFIHGTACLPALRDSPWAKANYEEEDAWAALSFRVDSELLVVRQCRVDRSGVDLSYYRWHGRKWHLLKRAVGPPPPVF